MQFSGLIRITEIIVNIDQTTIFKTEIMRQLLSQQTTFGDSLIKIVKFSGDTSMSFSNLKPNMHDYSRHLKFGLKKIGETNPNIKNIFKLYLSMNNLEYPK